MTHMSDTVGIRELRQNLSRYVDRVKGGESLTVTERGREVARLVPSGGSTDPYVALAERYGANVPTDTLEDLARGLEGKEMPTGTTDRLLAEDRRERA
jgi:prevent-host-death family protein